MVTLELRTIHEMRIALEDARALLQFSDGSAEERIARANLRITMALDAILVEPPR